MARRLPVWLFFALGSIPKTGGEAPRFFVPSAHGNLSRRARNWKMGKLQLDYTVDVIQYTWYNLPEPWERVREYLNIFYVINAMEA